VAAPRSKLPLQYLDTRDRRGPWPGHHDIQGDRRRPGDLKLRSEKARGPALRPSLTMPRPFHLMRIPAFPRVNELTEIDLHEVSVVLRPANPGATVEAVKQASGARQDRDEEPSPAKSAPVELRVATFEVERR
jgi:hypothetical protein